MFAIRFLDVLKIELASNSKFMDKPEYSLYYWAHENCLS